MAIKSITEFTIQPGPRDEFVSLFGSLVAQNLGQRYRGEVAGLP